MSFSGSNSCSSVWSTVLDEKTLTRLWAPCMSSLERCLLRYFAHFIIGYEMVLSIKDVQMKITMRYHFIWVRMATINKSTNRKWCRGCGEKGTLVQCWWECRLVQPLWKTVWNFLRKLKMELPFDPAIPLVGSYPKNPETPIQRNLCTPMFTAS